MWAIGAGKADTNPVIGSNKADEGDPRERELLVAEAVALWLARPRSSPHPPHPPRRPRRSPHIGEACINHLPAKLIRTYDRNKYESEKREALDLWASHLMEAVAQATGDNVTPLRKA